MVKKVLAKKQCVVRVHDDYCREVTENQLETMKEVVSGYYQRSAQAAENEIPGEPLENQKAE